MGNIISALSKKIISAIENISMKKKFITAVSIIPFIAVTNMSGSCAISCPYGMVNDPYPGQCPRYIDIRGEGICDLSQTTTAATTTDTSNTPTDDTTTTDSVNWHEPNPDTTIQYESANSNTTTTPDPSVLDSGNFQIDTPNYYILPVIIILIGSYLFTHYLFKKGILKRNKHRKIWNLLVTAGYLGTGVTGILLIIIINLGIRTALNPSITCWHVEMAILMVIGTIIHIYWKPFKKIFRVLFGIKSDLRKNLAKIKRMCL
ncbi:MAG: hypothetical protein PHY59_06090 [Methanobacterium sp.]|nr:hypothetical protein [Methanobacterium sp.]